MDTKNISGVKSITFLNESGDVSICWEDEDDSRMRQLIKTKLNQGYTFFITKGLIFKERVKLTNTNQLEGKQINVIDKDIFEFLQQSKSTHLINNSDETQEVYTICSTSDINEIATNSTVVVKPAVGG